MMAAIGFFLLLLQKQFVKKYVYDYVDISLSNSAKWTH